MRKRADRGTVTRVLADVARLGPYFALTVSGGSAGDGTEWRPSPELDPAAVRGLIDEHARRLGTTERRVAASIFFQGLAARLWSPVIAAAAAQGVVPDLSGLRWRLSPGTPVELWLADPRGWAAGDPAQLVHRAVVGGQLRPLAAAVRAQVGIAEGLLWGNAASALAGTLHVRGERPDLAAPLGALIRRLLAMEPLRGTGSLTPDGAFRRRGCCLYYRVPPGGGLCGDCVLRRRDRV